jgi:S1-C subfamily serine protease
MKKIPLYSKSGRSGRPAMAGARATQPAAEAIAAQKTAQPVRRFARTRSLLRRHERLLLVLCSVLLSAALFVSYSAAYPPSPELTQRDIDAAVKQTLAHNVFPSEESRAFARIRPSVVRVTQYDAGDSDVKHQPRGVGTGIVVVDKGIILTNLHVVAGAPRLQVQFANGMESDAVVINVQPDNDLAVLQAKNVPDDLIPATLRSTRELDIGDKVMAIGFPFNIGPSASSGIVSGLHRNYMSQEGKRVLANLIQFDAAANPGNSGGPLVTMDGQVVGIVTAILNPNEQSTFVGIGFAVPIDSAAAAAGESPF